MKKIDFLFLYEVRAREVENLCLIKQELEKRGYSVELRSIFQDILHKNPRIQPRVIITAFCYNDYIIAGIENYASKCVKFLNMHWEEVSTNSVEFGKNTDFQFSGIASEFNHIVWGNKIIERKKDYMRDAKNLILTGPVHMDFLRNDFKDYYLSREELFNEFNIDSSKNVCLFVSSFTLSSLPKIILDDIPKMLGKDYYESAMGPAAESQLKILKWLEKKLEDAPDTIIIYRPHPAEIPSGYILELEAKYKNFRIILDKSVKQWFLAVDKIFLWQSTSIAEAYFSKKNCGILRPVKLEDRNELTIYKDAKHIIDYQAFSDAVDAEILDFPCNKDLIEEYYLIDEKPCYLKISEFLEELLNTDKYDMHPEGLAKIASVIKSRKLLIKLKRTFVYSLYSIYIDIKSKKFEKSGKIKTFYRGAEKQIGGRAFLRKLDKRNTVSAQEIEEISNKIKEVLNLNDK